MSFAPLLHTWRRQRRLSQAALADIAEVSPRHLSCLETGKARPSEQMVLVLASALEVPLRERNTWLRAAGFPPAYTETDLFADPHAAVRHALELVVHHAPFGAVAVDRRWRVLMMGGTFAALGLALLERPLAVGDNLLERTFAHDGLRPHLRNWEAVARTTLERLRREAATEGDPELWALHESLLAMDGVPAVWRRPLTHLADRMVVPVELTVRGQALSLFTTLTTIGTPLDVALSELRVESYYPADAATEAALRALAAR